MKAFFCCCLLVSCLISSLTAQSITFPIDFDTLKIEKYDHHKPSPSSVLLRMPYGSYKILHPAAAKVLEGKTILAINLIYTDYPEDDDFSLLNQQRLAALFLVAPELFQSPYIQWQLVAQTAATSSDAYHFYHGFEIIYRPAYTPRDEKKYLTDIINGYTPLSDSTLLKIMQRNDWKNMTVVGDFTGSMSPYIAQLLLWYNLTVERNKQEVNGFVFFNDGDATPNSEKQVGKTGGIYHTKEKKLDSVLTTAVTTIQHGGGGDAPENDVEALLFAQAEYGNSEHFILVADNLADMRDIELADSLKMPVRVILCGATQAVNTQYIDLAYRTKGSIHTIEEDISDLLQDIKEGEVLEINGQKFRLVNGKFERVRVKRT